ncbi:MFS transporter [Dietzia psychralcaliphila]|uniref:MFS transporter n=1 Tax=Dietzia psychralcaliphila TaxID=139021 RepID=UPI001C1E5438|nr:MFS transporter [Dietzia psychralcaliphila]
MTSVQAPPRATARTWAALGVLALPMLLLAIDATVLIFAMPGIAADLSPSATQQLWIMDIYSFMIAGLLVTMGAVGDRIGKKRLLLIGAVLFTAASVVGAFATSSEQLIVARAFLGMAGATIMPSTLSLIRAMFIDRAQRRFAIAVWSMAGTLGAAAGPIVGGWMLEHFWWGSAFLINIPVMVVLLVLGPVLLTESRDPSPGSLDLASAAMSLVAMLSAVYGLKTLVAGDGVVTGVLCVAVGLAVGAVFVRRQLRLTNPLLDVDLFRARAFRGAVVADLLSIFALIGALWALTQYLQLVVGLSPLQAGVWLLPAMAVSAAAAFLAAALVKRISAAILVTVGLLVAAVGFGLMLGLTPDSGPVPVIVALSLVSLGGGVGMTLTNDIIMSSAPPARAGRAAAISETAYELGTALGTAILGSVLAAVYRSQLLGNTGAATVIPPAQLERASATIAEAFTVAGQYPAAAAEVLITAAQAAFTDALTTVGLLGSIIMVVAAVWTAVTLRGTSATADLTRQADHGQPDHGLSDDGQPEQGQAVGAGR